MKKILILGLFLLTPLTVQASDITWADKVTGNSVTAANMNEIKTAVNSKYDSADLGVTLQGYDANLPTWPATVDATEVGYLNGVTSALQTQLDAKEGDLSNEAGLYSALSDVSVFYEPGDTLRTNSSTTLPGTCTAGELYLDTDADTNGELYLCVATDTWKASDDDGGAGGMSDIVEDTTPQLGGNLDIQTYNIEGVDATEFGYVDGVTSDIQTQLDAKEGDLSNEAGLYAALSDVTQFYESGDAATFSSVTIDPSTDPAITINDSDGAGAETADKLASNIKANFTTVTEDAEVSDVWATYMDAGTETTAFLVDGSDNQVEFGINTTLQAGDIAGSEIANDAIDSAHYADGSIDTAHIAADQITGALIADDQIDSEHYVAASIDNEHLADDAVGTDELSNTLNIVTTGTIQGAVNIVTTTDGTESPTASQMYGTFFVADHATAANDTDYTLPSAVAGMAACFYDNGAGTGGIIIDAATGDEILLDGTGIGAADALDSPGVAGDGANGDFVCLLAIDATNWVTLGISGTWVDGGAD